MKCFSGLCLCYIAGEFNLALLFLLGRSHERVTRSKAAGKGMMNRQMPVFLESEHGEGSLYRLDFLYGEKKLDRFLIDSRNGTFSKSNSN